MPFIFLLAIIAVLAFVKVRWALYLLLVLLPAYLWRTEVSFVPTTFLELSIYLVFAIWLTKALAKRELFKKTKRLFRLLKPFLIPIILFLGAAVLSTIISPDKRLSLGVLKAWFLDPLLVLILLLDSVRGKSRVKFVILSLFLSVAWVSLFGLYEWITDRGLDSDGRLNSVFIPANYVAMLAVPILVLSFVFLKKHKSRLLRTAHYGLLAAILLALYLSESYGGWLALLGALIFLWFKVCPPSRRLKYLLLFGLLVIAVSALQSQSIKFGNLFEFSYRTSSATRFEIWQTSVLIIRNHPLLGVGLGNFEAAYREYLPYIAFPPLEWLVVKPHNLYLNLWIEMGILGLASFLGLGIFFFKKAARALRVPAGKYTAAAMIALLVHGLVDTPYFKNDLSVLFWVLIGLILILGNKETKISQNLIS